MGKPTDRVDDIGEFLESLVKDHDDLSPRLRTVTHSTRSAHPRVNLRAHYIAFRGRHPTLDEFVDVLSQKLVRYSLHRKHYEDTMASQEAGKSLSNAKLIERAVRLHNQALDLFKRASRATNRNGEFGELVCYILIESILRAPQLLAKMSLKTSTQMPVHGSDGIHVGFDPAGLVLYWAESKCHSSVSSALSDAARSMLESMEGEKIRQELFLITQNIALFVKTRAGEIARLSSKQPCLPVGSAQREPGAPRAVRRPVDLALHAA